jgi:hypothetical protein
MKTHPMLFNGAMVRAILDGRKTQDRRLVKPQSLVEVFQNGAVTIEGWLPELRIPYGTVGSIIWVRETWADVRGMGFDKDLFPLGAGYRADCKSGESLRIAKAYGVRWRPSIHMPRWASRIDLEVTAVRVERVQDISDNDAESEGVDLRRLCGCVEGCATCDDRSPKDVFRDLWQSIYANWDANPFVWVYEFRRVK